MWWNRKKPSQFEAQHYIYTQPILYIHTYFVHLLHLNLCKLVMLYINLYYPTSSVYGIFNLLWIDQYRRPHCLHIILSLIQKNSATKITKRKMKKKTKNQLHILRLTLQIGERDIQRHTSAIRPDGNVTSGAEGKSGLYWRSCGGDMKEC